MSLPVGSSLGFSGRPTSCSPAGKVTGRLGPCCLGGRFAAGWAGAELAPSHTLHRWDTHSRLSPGKGDTNSLEKAASKNTEPFNQAASLLVLRFFH